MPSFAARTTVVAGLPLTISRGKGRSAAGCFGTAVRDEGKTGLGTGGCDFGLGWSAVKTAGVLNATMTPMSQQLLFMMSLWA